MGLFDKAKDVAKGTVAGVSVGAAAWANVTATSAADVQRATGDTAADVTQSQSEQTASREVNQGTVSNNDTSTSQSK